VNVGRFWGGVAAILAVLAALALAPIWLAPRNIDMLSLWAVTTIAAIGLSLTLGLAGQVSLAQGAFVGIGAYACALLSPMGWPFAAVVALSGLLSMAVAWPVGLPALRAQRRGYLPLVTLAFAVLVHLVLRNEAWLTGGSTGLAGIARPTVLDRSLAGARDFYYLCLAVLCVAALCAWWIGRSPWGRAYQAMRANPVRAASLGVDVSRYALVAFSGGAGLGGIAGALYAPLLQHIDPSRFAPEFSLYLLVAVIVGGSGSALGPFLGTALMMAAQHWLGQDASPPLILLAAAGIAVLALCPSGMMGTIQRLLRSQTESRAR
jgi:branched-chain amino acid transport system permease protein